MKKILFALILATMLCAFSSCGKDAESSSSTSSADDTATEATTTEITDETEPTTTEVVSGAVIATQAFSTESVSGSETEQSQTEDNAKTDKPAEAVFAASDMTFTYKGVSLKPDSKFPKETADKLGTYQLTAAPSCAYEGDDKIYEYPDFTIYTYPAGSEDKILEIELTGGGVSTTKGVKVGMSTNAAIAIYGSNYEIDGASYKYSVDTASYMEITMANNKVSFIRYVLA